MKSFQALKLALQEAEGDDDGGIAFLLMELMSCDLNSQIPMDENAAARVTRQIASGLIYMHQELGLVHRDVKPGNIFLSGQTAKLGDFGVATKLVPPPDVAGTPEYFPSEVWAGDEPVTAKVDVYGLGCTLYEMLEGRLAHPVPPSVRSPLPNLSSRAWRSFGGKLQAAFEMLMRRSTPGLIEVIGTLNLTEAIEPSTAAAFERKKRKEREMASEETKKAANRARELRRKQKKGAAAAQWLCLQKAKPQPKCCCPSLSCLSQCRFVGLVVPKGWR
ncbi:unnamed protein product [Effrenium voratum]|uniref:Protein kinase domain-containing protein n=1 Tax=Effrenium voratum TaxID=2562239 RepID=A0AA36I430_9DINO|nr:unnamed protein product [Effrenium voratum]